MPTTTAAGRREILPVCEDGSSLARLGRELYAFSRQKEGKFSLPSCYSRSSHFLRSHATLPIPLFTCALFHCAPAHLCCMHVAKRGGERQERNQRVRGGAKIYLFSVHHLSFSPPPSTLSILEDKKSHAPAHHTGVSCPPLFPFSSHLNGEGNGRLGRESAHVFSLSLFSRPPPLFPLPPPRPFSPPSLSGHRAHWPSAEF